MKREEQTEVRADAQPDIEQLVERVRSISHENERMFRQLMAGEERLRSLAKSVWQVQEEERRRFARELHDGIGQTLTALRNQLERLHRRTQDEEALRDLGDSVELAAQALQDTRELSRLLRPAVLDDLGLEPALSWLTRTQTQRTGLAIDLTVRGVEDRLAPDVETLVFRVVQEALTNTVKHAEADRAKVEVEVDEGRLRLVVQDEGRGFDPTRPDEGESSPGCGLRSMRDRVELFSGRLQLDSSPGAGTRIRIDLPLAEHGSGGVGKGAS